MANDEGKVPFRSRKPSWLKVPAPGGPTYRRLKKSIEAYRQIAGFDISQNPGITATLYNVGNPEARAAELKAENAKRRQQGLEPRLPQVNYYGWLVNDKLPELAALF